VITIQRVRVRWDAATRGATHANARRGLCRPVRLPAALPEGDVVIHEVLTDFSAGRSHHERTLTGTMDRAHDLGLWLRLDGGTLIVERSPGSAAHPSWSGPDRLFRLEPRQVGQYRANFRFSGYCCGQRWSYEEWLIRIGHNGVDPETFSRRRPVHDVDRRVRLYGGGSSR
jgi:hypothetical protein